MIISNTQQRSYYIALFVIALASLAYQILLTRIFSVMLYYHFAFAGISIAMFGLTAGAQRVHFNPHLFTPERLQIQWAKYALGFSVSSALLVVGFLYFPLLIPNSFRLVIESLTMLFFFVFPFFCSGVCVTLLLTKSGISTGKLYAADLVGAALGSIGIVATLFFLDPVTLVFALSGINAAAAWLLVRTNNARLSSACLVVMSLMLVAAALQANGYVNDTSHFKITWAKFSEQKSTLFEKWNAFSRVRVVPRPPKPFGWGLSRDFTTPIEQYSMDIDADASTPVTRFDGDLKPFYYLQYDVINVGYLIRPIKDVAVIGVGGGRDIMSALYFGVHKVTGLELNPTMFEVLTKRYSDFVGNFYKRPDVELINTEARSWMSANNQTFDLIQISLIDTWSATAAGGLTLSENRLYTVEAWKEFLAHLNPGGELVVSRWFKKKLHPSEFYRLLSLAVTALEGMHVPASEVRQHILAFNVNNIITVVVSPTAFSSAELQHAKDTAKEKNFTIMMSPDTAWDETSETIASGKADKAFYDHLPQIVDATTDDRPFFFFFIRLKDMFYSNKGSVDDDANIFHFSNNIAVTVVFLLLGVFFVATLLFAIEPVSKMSKQVLPKDIWLDMGYFAAIGIGFMLIEISQMQRLIVFLGHPVYGLSVVLFTLLLSGGLGSFTVDARVDRAMWKRPFILCIVLAIIGLITPFVTEHLNIYTTPVRIIASAALLAPAGFFMGMMFPIGMRMTSSHTELQPLLWSINGSTSVFASVLAAAISIEWGIAAAYWFGALSYLICLLLICFRNRKKYV